MASVILGAETPINVWKDRLVFEVNRAEDSAAYSLFPFCEDERSEKRGLYAFSTFSGKYYVDFDTNPPKLTRCFGC